MTELLFLLLLIPLGAGAMLLLFAGVSQQRTARWIALGGSIASLGLSLALLGDYRELPTSASAEGAASQTSPIQPRVEYRRPWLTIGGDAEGRGGRCTRRSSGRRRGRDPASRGAS